MSTKDLEIAVRTEPSGSLAAAINSLTSSEINVIWDYNIIPSILPPVEMALLDGEAACCCFCSGSDFFPKNDIVIVAHSEISASHEWKNRFLLLLQPLHTSTETHQLPLVKTLNHRSLGLEMQ